MDDDDATSGSGVGPARVDSDYVEFVVVPVMLRARFAYDEANKVGDALKKMTESEVKVIMTNASTLCQYLSKAGVKLPGNWEKSIHDDMVWQKGGAPGNRKSFVYYAAAQPASPSSGERPGSNGGESGADSRAEARSRAQTRQRMSFAATQLQMGVSEDEGDANRYKVQSRQHQSESISKDLADLVATLGQLEAGKKPGAPPSF